MLKRWGFVLLGVFFLLALIGNVKAQVEYTNGNLITTAGIDPKVSCVPNTKICFLMTYDNSPKVVKLYYTTDGFLTDIRAITNVAYDFSDYVGIYTIGGAFWGHLPYDVAWDDSTNKFWFVVGNNVWNWNSGDWVLNFQYIVPNNGTDCVKTSNYPLDILKIDLPYMYGVCTSGGCDANITRFYYNNGTRDSTFNIVGVPTGTPHAPCYSEGFFAGNGFPTRYRIRIGSVGISKLFDNTSLTTINQIFEINNYIDNYVYWNTRAAYVSENSVFRSLTTDFNTYGSQSTYYYYNTSDSESIQQTDISSRTDSIYREYAFKRTGNLSGVYAYSETLLPYTFVIQSYDPITGTYSSPNVTATIGCNGSSILSTGSIFTVSSPCVNGANLTLDTTEFIPQSYLTTINSSFIGSCNAITIAPIYTNRTVTIPIRVYDSISGLPISGASVTLNSIPYITDSNGTAFVTVTPISSATFVQTAASPCVLSLYPTGNPTINSLTISAAGYESYINNTKTFVTFTGAGTFSVTPELRVILDSTGARVNVHIRTFDGTEIFPISDIVTINGANQTYWYRTLAGGGYERLPQNTGWVFPALFVLINNVTPFNINLSLLHTNITYTNFDYNGLTYSNLSVNNNQSYTIYFTLPQTIFNLSCTDNRDCIHSFCNGNAYYLSTGCQNSVCTYETQDCVNCDSLIGCFDVQTSQQCNSSFECPSICSGTHTSEYGLCSSAGFCVRKRVTCQTINGCINITANGSVAGICAEMQFCYKYGENRFTFIIQTGEQNPAIFTPNPVFKTWLDVDFTCGISNANTRSCVSGISITPSNFLTLSTPFTTTNQSGVAPPPILITNPSSWAYVIESDDSYTFSDLSVLCDSTCNITTQFCTYGCNIITGYCNSQVTAPQTQLKNSLGGFSEFLNSTFPDMNSRMLVVLSITISVVVAITYILNKVNHSSNWQISLGAMIVMILTAAFVGWFDPLVTILFCIVAGYILIRFSQLWQSA